MLFLFLGLFTVSVIAEAADNINPDKTNVFATEGSDTTLSCTYTESADTLHWYQQKPGSKPEFLLLIYEKGKQVIEAQPPYPQFSIKLDQENKKVDLFISSAAVSDTALYYCALEPYNFEKLIIGEGIKLLVQSKEKKEPNYYKVTPQNETKESCLATGFTNHNATDLIWNPKDNSGAVRFEGEGYYSRLILNEVENCTETDVSGTCGKSESGNYFTFNSDHKTRFLSLSIFWLRVLFLKTIVFNILMTLKVWMT